MFSLRPKKNEARAALQPLYANIVLIARAPHWYLAGAAPDTLDGRFDMVAAVMALVLMRLEQIGARGIGNAALLTEIFIEDMDAQLRQIGVGDLVVGNHIGRMVAALGGRLGAYRETLDDDAALREALVRNLYRGVAPAEPALDHMIQELRALAHALAAQDEAALLCGEILAA